jgi:hypothetical protein
MHRRGMVWILILSISIFPLGIVEKMSAQENSSLEERARWVEITHKLESNPMNESANKEGDWALKRLSDVRDVHIPLCKSLLVEFNNPTYTYSHAITRQYMLASAAFMIENPSKVADHNALNLAAVESVLMVYTGILQQQIDGKTRVLSDLLKKRSEGKLYDAIRKQCA